VNPLHRLIGFARPYRGRFMLALAAMVLYAAASAGVVALIGPIFDEVLPDRERLAFWAWMVVAVYVAKGLGAYFSVYLMTDVGQRVVRDIRNRLFRHILDQSAGFFTRKSTGSLISRITNDVNQIQQVVSETLGDLLRESLALLGYAVWLFYLDWQLALVAVTGAPLAAYPLARFGQRIRSTTRRSQEEMEHLTHVTAEAFTGHRIVKAFGAEAHEAGRFRRAAQQVYRTNLKVTSILATLPPLMELLGGLAVVALVWYGSQQIARNELTAGQFTSFIVAAFMMYTPVKKLSRVNASIQQAMAAAERIFEILDTHSEVRERPNAVQLKGLYQGIEFQNVAFAYEDRPNEPILRDVSFRVAPGEMVAIVGLSGAGKTTLVNLIPRFYDVTGGTIRIDGVDIRDMTLSSLRSKIAMVTQETVLFAETIAANIAYGRPDASREEIEAAARTAHAHEFIVNLPQKYDSRIGERGQMLSGGQRQRIAIARAILKNAPILILDEATSALDAESELLVQDALQTLMRNRTSFVIAHRLSTVRRADQIIVLEKGRIVEVGKHDDLLARPNSVYSKLYALQAFGGERRSHVRPHPTIQ
jgi:subfamily B ATP-binding cassette protein MsbA